MVRAAARREEVEALSSMNGLDLADLEISSRQPGGWEGRVFIADDFDNDEPAESGS